VTRLIFLGPPGAGKGTQAQKISQLAGIPHISTGEILRDAITNQTTLGQKAQSYVDKGELVPDGLILDLIGERLSQDDTQTGWILDGFPRNVSQAEFLDQLLAKLNQKADYAVNFAVDDQVLVTRMLARGRKDDNEDTISRRLQVYREQTAPVIDYYQQRNELQSVDGDRPLEEVTVTLKGILNL
jgi:adenylate kinase